MAIAAELLSSSTFTSKLTSRRCPTRAPVRSGLPLSRRRRWEDEANRLTFVLPTLAHTRSQFPGCCGCSYLTPEPMVPSAWPMPACSCPRLCRTAHQVRYRLGAIQPGPGRQRAVRDGFKRCGLRDRRGLPAGALSTWSAMCSWHAAHPRGLRDRPLDGATHHSPAPGQALVRTTSAVGVETLLVR
jgi:hypothetical protein